DRKRKQCGRRPSENWHAVALQIDELALHRCEFSLTQSEHFLFFKIRPPPKSTLFPYTTLFRSRSGTRPPRCHRLARASDVRHSRSEEHTSELQSLRHLVCRLLLEKKNAAGASCLRLAERNHVRWRLGRQQCGHSVCVFTAHVRV